MNTEIKQKTNDPVINIALDTIDKKKQALVFVNAKRSAEKQAEEISKKIKESSKELENLADGILKALSRPTRQCNRLALCVKKGIAFHHAGLAYKQKELIEDAFRQGTIKIICATPTLAAGLDLPAFRAVIRDVKRYTGRFGMQFIPVLEFLQMAGRCGRPKFDKFGESIVVAKSKPVKKEVWNRYIMGEPEDIYSKLAVEPALRMYLLSLIATRFVQTKQEIMEFFKKTFWAYQFRDMRKLEKVIDKMLGLLEDWEFLQKKGDDFVSADEYGNDKYRATILGKRVAELYLDPLTAYNMICALRKASIMKILKPFSFLQVVSNTLEMRPQLRVKVKEFDDMQEKILEYDSYLLQNEPSIYEPEHEDYMNSIKTAAALQDWIDENDEEFLLEKYDVRPGEIRMKIEIGDWLLYTMTEFLRLLQFQPIIKEIQKLRFRLKYGVKEELLPLLRLEGIGRVRARKMFQNKIKNLGDVKKVDIQLLIKILGKKIAIKVKKQVGVYLKVF